MARNLAIMAAAVGSIMMLGGMVPDHVLGADLSVLTHGLGRFVFGAGAALLVFTTILTNT